MFASSCKLGINIAIAIGTTFAF